jgi:CheY-like chemotaxis protein
MAQTVLVVDDSIASQRLFEMVLKREGYDVVTVGSGREVLDRVQQTSPDLALIDAIMPEVDGYQICKTLKRDPQLKTLPVILLAGAYEDFDSQRGAQLVGQHAILQKPSKSQEIVSKVKEVLSQQAQQPRAEDTGERAAPAAQAPPPSEEEGQEEPTVLEATYELDENSEEADLVVETEILDEEAEWEDEEVFADTNIEEIAPEITSETSDIEASAAQTPPPPPSPEAGPAAAGQSATTGVAAISEENLDMLAEEVAKRLADNLVPVLTQAFTNYLLQLPGMQQAIEKSSKQLVKEILPDIQDSLR